MRRALLALLVLGVVLAGGLALGGEALLNTGAVRERVAAAVARATGHGVAFGRLGLAWSAAPSVSVRDARLLNPPGFSGPDFATVARIEVRVALWPLLGGRVEVPEVTVQGAAIRLERDAAGRGNWLPPASPAAAPATSAGPRERRPMAVGRVVIEDAHLEWWGGPPIEVPRLVASPAGGAVEGRAVFRGVGFTLAGRTGAVDQAPVPVDLTLVGGGLALSLSGQAGGEVMVQALVPDLAALQPLLGRAVPSVREIKATVAAGPGGIGAIRVTAAGGEPVPGLVLTRLDASAAGPDAPLAVVAEGRWRALPVSASLNLASVRAALAGGAVPFQALVLADGGRVAAQGSVDRDGRVDAAVTGEAPDLARLGALAGVALPPARDVAGSVQVLPPASGAGVVLRGLRLKAAQGDVAGDLALGFGARPSVRGTVQAGRLDLDALSAAPLAPVVAVAPPAPPPAPAAATRPSEGNLVPPLPLPFAALRALDADVRVAAGQVTWRGGAWRATEARVVLRDGKLRLDPAQALAPGGPVTAQVGADADASSVTLVLRGAGLDAGGLSGGEVSGTLDVDVRLAGAGGDLRTLAASATGHVGVALADGEVENQVLVALFGPVLRAASVPLDVQGRSRVRCLALRTEAAGGIARVTALALDSNRLRLDGEGAVNLVDDTLDLHLRPTLRIGPTGVAIPVRLTGPVRAPRPELERGAIAPGRVGISIGGVAADPCPAALTAARAP